MKDNYTIDKLSVKRIISIFGMEIRIPVPLWYPRWKHKSEWTVKKGKDYTVQFDITNHSRATKAQVRSNVKKVSNDLTTPK